MRREREWGEELPGSKRGMKLSLLHFVLLDAMYVRIIIDLVRGSAGKVYQAKRLLSGLPFGGSAEDLGSWRFQKKFVEKNR